MAIVQETPAGIVVLPTAGPPGVSIVGPQGAPGEAGPAGDQGPPGGQGPAGAGALINRTATTNVPPWTAIIADGAGGCRPADPSDLSQRQQVIAVTAYGGVQNVVIQGQNAGDLLGPNASFTPGSTLFVGAGGVLTSTPPTSGWRQAVASVIADGHIVVNLGEATIIATDVAMVAATGFSTPANASDVAMGQDDGLYVTPAALTPVLFARLSDRGRLLMLGWTGDNQNRKLSDLYPTLAAARAVFPSAQSLTEYVDGCALERVIQLNSIYFGRSQIKLPAGGTRVSRTINTTGIEVWIEGCGPSSQIIGMGAAPVFLHGIGERLATSSDPQNRPFRMVNLRMDQEGPVAGSCALDISYYDDAGIWYATKILDVDFRGFQYPIRMRNPGRGWQMQRCGFFGPDSTTMPNGAVTVVTDSYAKQGSAQLTAISNKFANYRWGFEIDMQPPFAAYGKPASETRRSLEDVTLLYNTAQNGWGLLKVNCNQVAFGYSSLLWNLHHNDWQGSSHGLWMRNCNKIEIKGGFWIGNQPKPAGDATDPLGSNDKDPLTGLPERRYMSLYLCDDVDIEGCRIDVTSDYGASCLIHLDGCRNVNIDKLKVRAGNPSLNAGVRMIGVDENTIREMDTEWTIWGSSTNNRVVDVNGNQVSQTNVLPYGTVDRTGEYELRGLTGVLTVPSAPSDGYKVRFEFPRRPAVPTLNGGQAVPFFLSGNIGDPFSPYVLVSARAAGYVPTPTITASDVFGFDATFPNTMGGAQIQLEYQVRGR